MFPIMGNAGFRSSTLVRPLALLWGAFEAPRCMIQRRQDLQGASNSLDKNSYSKSVLLRPMMFGHYQAGHGDDLGDEG